MTRTAEDQAKEAAAAGNAEGLRSHWRDVPTGVWALGFVSMLMDISSEMIHALLPVYMVTVLGTSALTVGMIEGIAEATASVTKVFSGALSDWLGKRKWLAAFGYGLAAFTKPIFPLAPTVGWLVAARFIDRVGKGIRGAPRDALVADISPPHLRGASFGLRQSLDTVGAFLGPLIAIGLMWLTANHFRTVFWIAVLPAFLSFALITIAVHEPERPSNLRRVKLPLHRSELGRLGATYWGIVVVATVFTLARFSEAFLVLKAQAIGLPLMLVPAVMVVMNVAYALSAYPVGVLSDRTDRVTILIAGLLLLAAADLALVLAPGLLGLGIGVVLWGLHMGFTQGLLATLIADAAPAELRGTAFGMFNLATGVALLAASMIAGGLWDAVGPAGTFLAGAGFSALTLIGPLGLRTRLASSGR
ncbi:MFS transporter [Mesorhizobium sp. M1D.F.Ca.ET.043.01.1.1]|uniref:MFS transporter n=1 Tax=Mesorhizobium sp. M1D.F.Ca.ET.043.01.1.1 TaxID=2493669 RepID=UPI000F7575AD|nr:MFS transporter [Mesorhizobium sp. M1D.F.Ca.ET.043.01.1.1]AZO71226.1 MFS transporter [Mesorhizobium sp. M1D.F.Ca.ET.043.01.1.1]